MGYYRPTARARSLAPGTLAETGRGVGNHGLGQPGRSEGARTHLHRAVLTGLPLPKPLNVSSRPSSDSRKPVGGLTRCSVPNTSCFAFSLSIRSPNIQQPVIRLLRSFHPRHGGCRCDGYSMTPSGYSKSRNSLSASWNWSIYSSPERLQSRCGGEDQATLRLLFPV